VKRGSVVLLKASEESLFFAESGGEDCCFSSGRGVSF
jgi:hypothetical protein